MSKNKEEFLRQKKGVRNEADETAQQLINIYRQLSVLGEAASERYNQQLLAQVNSDVLASLKTIPGGEEIRAYYGFLTDTDVAMPDTSAASGDDLEKLLPKAEDVSPLWSSYGVPQTVNGQTPAGKSYPSGNQSPASVITKTVQVRVGLDEEKVKQAIQNFEEKQKSSFQRVFQDVVIDSNIDIMHTQIQNMSTQVMSIFQSALLELTEALKQCKVDETPTVVSQTDESKKKVYSGFALKNTHRKTDHKFSVDMSEEE